MEDLFRCRAPSRQVAQSWRFSNSGVVVRVSDMPHTCEQRASAGHQPAAVCDDGENVGQQGPALAKSARTGHPAVIEFRGEQVNRIDSSGGQGRPQNDSSNEWLAINRHYTNHLSGFVAYSLGGLVVLSAARCRVAPLALLLRPPRGFRRRLVRSAWLPASGKRGLIQGAGLLLLKVG